LAQQWDELFCVFVGEAHSGAIDRVDGDRRRDEVGESMRPFGFEEMRWSPVPQTMRVGAVSVASRVVLR
jgi:hypothetical protein